MRTSDFDYRLPPELIAQTPVEPRDSSRLLVLHRASHRIEHRRFHQLIECLGAGDVLVLNQSRVIPGRLRGRREGTGGKVELLLLRREGPGVWQALAQPARRLGPGARIVLDPPRDLARCFPRDQATGGLEVEVVASHPGGVKTVRLASEEDLGEHLGQLGEMPLPPYIHRRLEDPGRYQTVYARQEGSAAAPTAGLHFTGRLLERLKGAGVELAFVTLHVGLDTFRPVQVEDPTEHHIHTEYYELGIEASGILNRARQGGRRIIAVGTTSVRVLEQVAQDMAHEGRAELAPSCGQADIFILPGHRFRLVDAMITNFHLPRSSLLMLVSAFAGRQRVLSAYQEAIRERYRFYSFGDAMLIV